MSEQHKVTYQISLEDLLSGKVKAAEATVHHFESAVHNATHVTRELFTMAVAGFGLYKGLEILKESVEEYNKVAIAGAEINAVLANTSAKSGITFERLNEDAEEFTKHLIGGHEAILGMQKTLVAFPAITAANLKRVEEDVYDLAAHGHTDLSSASELLGRALSKPDRGLRALASAGIIFTKQQQKVISALVDSGHQAQATDIILAKLESRLGGEAAAAAATEAGQMKLLEQEFDAVKISLGKLIMEELVKLKPEIEHAIHATAEFVEWLAKNKDGIERTTIAVVKFGAEMWALGKLVTVVESVGKAWAMVRGEVALTTVAAQEAQASMYMANGSAAYNAAYATQKVNTVGAIGGAIQRVAIAYFLTDAIAQMMGAKDGALGRKENGEAIQWYEPWERVTYKQRLAKREQERLAYEQNHTVPNFFPGDPLMPSWLTDPRGFASGFRGIGEHQFGKAGGGKDANVNIPTAPKVTGSNPITYNIDIGNIVKEFTVQTTNMTEAPQKIKELVAMALEDALNDVELRGVNH